MSSGRSIPPPVRREPLLSAGLTLTGYLLTTAVAGVFGGGCLSGLLAGHGFGFVAPHRMSATMTRIVADPAHPAAAWPDDPRPGPAWLTWLCVGLVAAVWGAVIAIAASEFDTHLRHRHRDGLAAAGDLSRLGLNERAATRKAAAEYPLLAGRQPGRRTIIWRRRRR